MRGSGRSWRTFAILCIASAATTVGPGGGVHPAAAHPEHIYKAGMAVTHTSGCGWQEGGQNHGRADGWNQIGRQALSQFRWYSLGACRGGISVDAGDVMHRGAVYWAPVGGGAGTLCVQGGWMPNAQGKSFVYYETWESSRSWCHDGSGGQVLNTHDIQTAIWTRQQPKPWGYATGNTGWPTTYHHYGI